MNNTFYTLQKQASTTLSARAAWIIYCSRKFSSGVLILVIGLACLGLGALTPTKATTKEHEGQAMEHRDDKMPTQEPKQQTRSQDIVEGAKIILMKGISNCISSCYSHQLINLECDIVDASAGLIWAIAARWDNNKEKLSCKDLFRMELFLVLLPKLATTSLYALAEQIRYPIFTVVKNALNLHPIVNYAVIPLLIYLSRRLKKST